MSVGFAHGIWTAVLVVTFVAIVIWVFAPKRAGEMEHAARIPLDDEFGRDNDNGANEHG